MEVFYWNSMQVANHRLTGAKELCKHGRSETSTCIIPRHVRPSTTVSLVEEVGRAVCVSTSTAMLHISAKYQWLPDKVDQWEGSIWTKRLKRSHKIPQISVMFSHHDFSTSGNCGARRADGTWAKHIFVKCLILDCQDDLSSRQLPSRISKCFLISSCLLTTTKTNQYVALNVLGKFGKTLYLWLLSIWRRLKLRFWVPSNFPLQLPFIRLSFRCTVAP